MLRKRTVLLTALAAGFATSGYGQSSAMPAPNEFGTQDYTVTVVDAASFTADTPFTTDYNTLSRHFPGDTGGHFFAGVNIPSGFVIDLVGTNFRCSGTVGPLTTLFRTDRTADTPYAIVSYPSCCTTRSTRASRVSFRSDTKSTRTPTTLW